MSRYLWSTAAAGLLVFVLTPCARQGMGQTRSRSTKPTLNKRSTTNTSLVAVGTELKIRLNDLVSSKTARVGDRFTATVIDPSRLDGAKVAGHVSSVKKSGRVKGSTQIGFAFDNITLSTGRTGTMHAQLRRVYDSDSVSKVDEEGHAESGGRGSQTLKRSGIGGAAGAIIGGIAGGGKGAAIGLIVGGAAGAGSIAIKGSKELRLEPGTEMLIKVTR
ncbi:MAG TPA: hypothetical protein VFV34_17480 [Blastocatellia bacterium]|nr:hypothetical protein [Blastocatellia bacterium]